MTCTFKKNVVFGVGFFPNIGVKYAGIFIHLFVI